MINYYDKYYDKYYAKYYDKLHMQTSCMCACTCSCDRTRLREQCVFSSCNYSSYIYSLGSGRASCRKARVYRQNLYKIFIWVLVNKKKLGDHCHDLHMCSNSNIFKMADLGVTLKI